MADQARELTYCSPVSGLKVVLSGTPFSNVYEPGEEPKRKIYNLEELRARCSRMDLDTGEILFAA